MSNEQREAAVRFDYKVTQNSIYPKTTRDRVFKTPQVTFDPPLSLGKKILDDILKACRQGNNVFQ
jgi:hypothetical protein